MADFHQHGSVATLHNLTRPPVAELERQLASFAGTRKITLILPSLYTELEGPALANIVATLAEVEYLNHIVIGLDRADEKQFAHAREYFSRLPQAHDILWNDACQNSDVVALHDCDILTYSREMLARLIYPVANPALTYLFCKGYYPRIADGKLNGRVSRLLIAPLLRALQKVSGPQDYLDYLQAFRYPLAGEFAMRTAILPTIRIPSDWGLEIGVLSEVWRNLGNQAVCQVDIADSYDHKHQPLSREDASRGLSRMSVDIAKALYRKLATDGVVFSTETFRTLKATYYRTALDLIEMYYNDAMMNGLHVDRHAEEEAVELFASNIVEAGRLFLDNPMETPFIPNWSRVNAAYPDLMRELREAVAADNA